MSEAFSSAVGRVDFKKYIEQFEEELKKILTEVGPGKTPQEVETTQTRLQALIRKQAQSISKELGLAGSHVLVFMTASTVLTAAWLSFSLRKETLDLSKSFEDRFTLTDMLNALEHALANVIAASSNYADISKK